MIPEPLVEQIRLRAEITEVVSEFTRLKRAGKTFRGPCPLHGGDGPNFSVDPAKGIFKCFVCGEGGNVFTFLQKHLGLSFPDAVRQVAARVGIEVPDRAEERRQEDPNRHLYELNAWAAQWFRTQLWDTDGGDDARRYLEKRGIGRDAAERFGLGWAPAGWRTLAEAAARVGHKREHLLELGLAKEPRDGGREAYDAFRERVIFPIEDLGGRVLGFGGRILGPAEEHIPKYLNSPESPIYHKGRVLYGLGWARGAVRKEEQVLVVEGYMDYVSLAAHGIGNAVAPLGTAMTPEQAELIARYTPRAVLLYDSDRAGLKATFRNGDELLRAGVEVLVATLPPGEDPDSLVRAKGSAALRRYLDDAVDVMERKIQILERKNFFASIRGRRQAVDALLPTVRAAQDEVLRGVYVGRIAEKTGVSRETLEAEVRDGIAREQRQAQARGGAPPPAPPGEAPFVPSPARRNGRRDYRPQPPQGAPRTNSEFLRFAADNPERTLLLLLLSYERMVEPAAQRVSLELLWNERFRALFVGLLETEGQRDEEGRWLEAFPPDTRPLLEELMADPVAATMIPPEGYLEATIALLQSRWYDRRLREIDEELGNSPPERQLALLRDKQTLVEMMKQHGWNRKPGFLRGWETSERPLRPYRPASE